MKVTVIEVREHADGRMDLIWRCPAESSEDAASVTGRMVASGMDCIKRLGRGKPCAEYAEPSSPSLQ